MNGELNIPMSPEELPQQRIHEVVELLERPKTFDITVGCVLRRNVSEKQAAIYLLLDFWKDEAQENGVDKCHWINNANFLSIAELAAIARGAGIFLSRKHGVAIIPNPRHFAR